MAALKASETDTFVLSAIREVSIFGPAPAIGKIHAIVREHSAGQLLGDVVLYDEAGACVVQCTGVRIQLFPDDPQTSRQSSTPAVIASNFTAEPVLDVLSFWGRELDRPWDITFAPYNQVFQQLIDPGSELNSNRSGVNATLVCLDDFTPSQRRLLPVLSQVEQEEILSHGDRYALPSGAEILHLNRYETEYLYKEIFTDAAYFRHGIELPANACVVDIGANIGMFTLAVLERCPDASIYAFEPSPTTFEVLKANSALYGSNVQAFNCGVSDRAAGRLHVLQEFSVFSGFQTDESEDCAGDHGRDREYAQ